MSKSSPNPKVDWYFVKENKWVEGFNKLRKIMLDTEMVEELKWGHPCYSVNGQNVVLMHGFKDYFALMFMKGVLMDDPNNLLIAQTENEQARRQIRFSSIHQVDDMDAVIREYVHNAIEVEKSGAQVKLKETKDFPVADEFQTRLDEDSSLKEAFESLTPGRQRGYLLYFAAAKQSKTRAERVEKYAPKIMDGLGLDD